VSTLNEFGFFMFAERNIFIIAIHPGSTLPGDKFEPLSGGLINALEMSDDML
jgi:hypothetical protein